MSYAIKEDIFFLELKGRKLTVRSLISVLKPSVKSNSHPLYTPPIIESKILECGIALLLFDEKRSYYSSYNRIVLRLEFLFQV